MRKLLALSFTIFFSTQALAAIDLERTGVGATTALLSQADGLSTDFSGANQTFSISAFVRPENANTTNMLIVSKYDSGIPTTNDGRAYRLYSQTTSKLYACSVSSAGTSGSTTSIASAVAAADGVSAHVGCIYDDATIQPYVDGVASGAGAAHTAGVYNSVANFRIGAQSDNSAIDGNTGWDGTIDDVCVWNTAITAADMATIYNSKQKGMCRQIKPANLVLYCALDACAEGASCTTDFNCSPGSPMSDTNTVTGASQRVLSYPPQGVQIS